MIRRIITVSIAFLALTGSCFAQGMFEPGDAGAPKYGMPGPICATDMNYLATPEPFSSGDQHNGFVFGWSFARHCFMIEPPKILIGPANLSADVNLTQNTFTFLDTAVGGQGFRSGLVQYVPQGVYMMVGTVSFTTTTANSNYEMECTIGTVDVGGAQAQILTGSPTPICGAAGTSGAGLSNYQLTYVADKFQCNAPYGKSCEIRMLVRTTDAGGVAKKTSTNLSPIATTVNGVMRMGGLDALQ